MARATKTSTSTRPRAAVKAPKRKPGRPIGSTGTKKSAPAAVAKAVKPSGRRIAVARVAKPNKAELESQLGKLERTVARLRDKNKELKQIATEAREHADTLEAQLAAKPAARPAARPTAKPGASAPNPARKSRRPAQPVAETVADEGASEQSDEPVPQG